MATRYFINAGAVLPEEALDHVERKHGRVVTPKFWHSPARESVYGLIEYIPHVADRGDDDKA